MPIKSGGEVGSQRPASAVHVRRAASGSWWTVDLDGDVISQWPSEFSAVDAGRVNARRFTLPLVIHDGLTERTEAPLPDQD